MSESKRVSYSITLRANPNDKNKIELINYLKSFDRGEATKKVEDILMAALLSLAKQYSGEYTPEQLRLSGLENCNALSHHSSYLRQALNIIEPNYRYIPQQARLQEPLTYINDRVNEVVAIKTEVASNHRNDSIALETKIEATEETEDFTSSLAEEGDMSDVMSMFG